MNSFLSPLQAPTILMSKHLLAYNLHLPNSSTIQQRISYPSTEGLLRHREIKFFISSSL